MSNRQPEGLVILYRACFTLLIQLIAFAANAQIKISGTFLDSATFRPVPFVQVQAGTTNVVQADEHGFFSITCLPGDTLHFSRVGYNPSSRIVTVEDLKLTIRLGEFIAKLNTVTIFGRFKPQGYGKWFENVLPGPFQNPNANETFGFSIPGPISYFTKYERERRKLRKLKAEHLATVIFRAVISSEEVRSHFMKLFELSEGQYHSKIEAFNIEFPEAQYIKEKEEIMDLLTYFFARKEK